MLQLKTAQLNVLDLKSTTKNIELLEAFMAECGFGRFITDKPNTLRQLAVRAVQRAANYGCHSLQDAGKVLVMMGILGEQFDLVPLSNGGWFEDPTHVDGAALDGAFQRLMNWPGLDDALRKVSQQST